MLPEKRTIRIAILACEETLRMTLHGTRDYTDDIPVIERRLDALYKIYHTGKPDIDIIKKYPNQREFSNEHTERSYS